ncbi:LEAF RUST 10 DISEASE-RESISTANCE LOCUS RECEPTOR-LIKE PROTEIN KINASE-like 1.2 [Cucurbita moschata]|uniref:non-specific serine/threonine protein kinase n=1 Tax=Cucurbita moschata TaxID=3662 RepID=A0A6J1F0X7_CUCMO|nr:LEAF RUST 10 DISEASE-RESISTANCE LOCUS RECEPTOR-LIKE PROTEIN KINASE-like 1.2 [Cucurbita moschata]
MASKLQILFKPTLFCFLTFIFSTSAVPDHKLNPCPPKSCGYGPNISYPFWIDGVHEPSCGDPDFKIKCNEYQYPVLEISDEDFIIQNIFPQNHSFLLASAAAYEQPSCPSHNISLHGKPFYFTSDTEDLFFFYDCPSKPGGYIFELNCNSDETHFSFAIFHKGLVELEKSRLQSCQSMILVPIRKNSMARDDLGKLGYVDILKMGFVLNWNCNDCKRSGNGNARRNNIIIGTCIGFGALLLCIIVLCICYRRRQLRRKRSHAAVPYAQRSIPLNPSNPHSVEELEKGDSYLGVHLFSYKELEEATNHFDSNKELGDGGFGTVYYGLLKDGRAVAVKRLFESNFRRVEQFMNEVEILARLRHRNLVSLYGCTSRNSRELLLVYEYVSNGTVADNLHGKLAKPGKLPWSTRMKIAIETASALVYLHASEIIHRDVKTNNILLDNNFCVKVADFGLSRLFPLDVTHVSTAPQGTPGYVDPEYHQCYQLSDKSDVFSFGVVLVELISSMPAVDITRHRQEINLFNMAIKKIQSHALNELVDPSLGFETDYKIQNMITGVAELAFRCLQSMKDERPTMMEVLDTLNIIQKQNAEKGNDRDTDISAKDDAVLLKNGYGSSPSSLSVSWVSSNTSTATNETVSA